MSKIDVKWLAMAARQVSLLRPGELDGTNAHSKNCHLAVCDGKSLEVRVTDSEAAFVGRYPLAEESPEWGVTVRAEAARTVFSRLSSLVVKESVGKKKPLRQRVQIELLGTEALELTGDGFVTEIPAVRVPNSFPEQELPGDGEWKRVPYNSLYDLLRYLTRNMGVVRPGDAPPLCTLFADGAAFASVGGVALSYPGPEIGLDVQTTWQRAARILAWLQNLPREGPHQVDWIEVARAGADEEGLGGVYFLRDESNSHVLWFDATPRPFPRDRYAEATDDAAEASAEVERAPLANTLLLIARATGHRKVVCTLSKASGRWRFEVATPGEPRIANALPANVEVEPEDGEASFEVGIRPLYRAITRESLRSVLLAYHESGMWLGVRSVAPRGAEDLPRGEAFVPAGPPSPESDAGEEDAEPGADEIEDEEDPDSTEGAEGS
jgi:hypothetical protein